MQFHPILKYTNIKFYLAIFLSKNKLILKRTSSVITVIYFIQKLFVLMMKMNDVFYYSYEFSMHYEKKLKQSYILSIEFTTISLFQILLNFVNNNIIPIVTIIGALIFVERLFLLVLHDDFIYGYII